MSTAALIIAGVSLVFSISLFSLLLVSRNHALEDSARDLEGFGKDMAERIREVTNEELARQLKPGGLLWRGPLDTGEQGATKPVKYGSLDATRIGDVEPVFVVSASEVQSLESRTFPDDQRVPQTSVLAREVESVSTQTSDSRARARLLPSG